MTLNRSSAAWRTCQSVSVSAALQPRFDLVAVERGEREHRAPADRGLVVARARARRAASTDRRARRARRPRPRARADRRASSPRRSAPRSRSRRRARVLADRVGRGFGDPRVVVGEQLDEHRARRRAAELRRDLARRGAGRAASASRGGAPPDRRARPGGARCGRARRSRPRGRRGSGSSTARATRPAGRRSTATAAARAFVSTLATLDGPTWPTIAGAIPYSGRRPLPILSRRTGRAGRSRRPTVASALGVGVDGRGDTGPAVLGAEPSSAAGVSRRGSRRAASMAIATVPTTNAAPERGERHQSEDSRERRSPGARRGAGWSGARRSPRRRCAGSAWQSVGRWTRRSSSISRVFPPSSVGARRSELKEWTPKQTAPADGADPNPPAEPDARSAAAPDRVARRDSRSGSRSWSSSRSRSPAS